METNKRVMNKFIDTKMIIYFRVTHHRHCCKSDQ